MHILSRVGGLAVTCHDLVKSGVCSLLFALYEALIYGCTCIRILMSVLVLVYKLWVRLKAPSSHSFPKNYRGNILLRGFI